MNHIDAVTRAIEFRRPDYLPMELVDVPKIYNAYQTLDPRNVKFIPGTEDFDSAWATYNWTFQLVGYNEKGEVLRKDEWGCLQKIPEEKTSAYVVLENPLFGKNSIDDYRFPSVEAAEPFFKNIEKIIKNEYSDRFICGYIDPGPFLIAYNLLDYSYFFIKFAEDVDFIVELIERIFDYQKQIVDKWKLAGAHMINLIDEFAGSSGMMFNPKIWRMYFKNLYADFFRYVHRKGLYSGILLDGDIKSILDDLMEMEIDVFQFVEPHAVGIDNIVKTIKGKRCIKASVDMKKTLAIGTPEEVEKEAIQLVKELNSREGGFICNVMKWYRPEFPEQNVLASVRGFNFFRKF